VQWLPKETEKHDNKFSQKPQTQDRASHEHALGRQHGRRHGSSYAVHEKTRAVADAKVRRSCFQPFAGNSASTPARA